jgi:hypothetical protein
MENTGLLSHIASGALRRLSDSSKLRAAVLGVLPPILVSVIFVLAVC